VTDTPVDPTPSSQLAVVAGAPASPGTVLKRRQRWAARITTGLVMGGTQLEQESWPEPYIPTVPSAMSQPLSGGYGVGGGRMQQSCENKGMGCKNNKVLDCMYGMCGMCCTGAARQPPCNIARHRKNNKHT